MGSFTICESDGKHVVNCNRVIPIDYIELTKVVLVPVPLLQWTCWSREEAKNIEQSTKVRGITIF